MTHHPPPSMKRLASTLTAHQFQGKWTISQHLKTTRYSVWTLETPFSRHIPFGFFPLPPTNDTVNVETLKVDVWRHQTISSILARKFAMDNSGNFPSIPSESNSTRLPYWKSTPNCFWYSACHHCFPSIGHEGATLHDPSHIRVLRHRSSNSTFTITE